MQVKRTSGPLSAFFANSNAFAALPLCGTILPVSLAMTFLLNIAIITGSKQCCMEFMYSLQLN